MTRLTLLQAQRLAGTAAVLSAFAGAAASGDFGVPVTVLFVAAALGASLAGDRFAHKHTAIWTTLLFGALLVLGLQIGTGSLDIVLGAARFALLLTLHRLWNRQTERDELLLLLLSLLLLCAGAALSAELLFGLAFAAYAVTGTWALALTHLRWQIEAGKGPQGSAALLRSRRLITPPLLAALAGLALVGLAGASLLFLVFPRVTIGGLRRLPRARAMAGLSETVDLSGHGAIDDDPRVVLRATFDPDPGPEVAELGVRFRARTQEVWTGRGWRARDNDRASVSWLQPAPRALRAKGQRWQLVDVVAVAGASDGIVLTPPGWPAQVRFVRPLSARGNPYQLLRDGAGDLFYQPVEVGDLRYVISVQPLGPPPAQTEPVNPDDLPERVKLDLELPADLDPRVRALGEELARGKPAGAAAEAVRAYLEGRLRYTRELPGDVADPIADFLFVRQKGHCELFSSAMVLILRAGGIPARNVTGYYGGVRTTAGYYAFRAGDAHSWVEVWLPDVGWVTWDPTPAAGRGSRQPGLWASAVLLWDGLAARWRSSVVDFDLLAQARAAQQAMRLLQDAGRRLAGRGSGTAPPVPWRALGALAAAGLLGALWLWRRRARGRQPGRRAAPLAADARRAREVWREARERLQRAGLPLPPSATPREAARAVEERLPQAASPVRALVASCLQARWGGAPLPPDEARRLLRELRRALA